MVTNPKAKLISPLGDAHLRAIGAICVNWSVIEMAMEIAILGLYEIDTGRGLPLTANIGFQSRLALLRILATQGAIKDAENSKACTKILNRIADAYPQRNAAAHGLWEPTKVPQVARRMSIRAKGARLRCTNEPITVAELEDIAVAFLDLHSDFAALMKRMGLERPPAKPA
jgi:hypothetical protein